MLVFDITDRDTFEQLDHWLKELRDNCSEHCIVVLVPNKTDICAEDASKREVSQEESEEFARKHNLVYLGETSAKDDINIKGVFEGLLSRVHWRQKDVQEMKKIEAVKLGQKVIHNEEQSCFC